MLALDDEQEMLVSVLADIAEREFADRAFTWEGEFPWKNVRLLADQGLFGLNIAEAYGGGGMTELEAILAIETVGTVCPDTANALYGQTMVAPRAIEMFGTETAKEEYLPPVCNGESVIAIAISEPHAGSDVGSMNTRVERTDAGLRITGEKIWVSWVPDADAAVVWTRFPDDNLGTVVVDLDADGVEIGEHYTNMAGDTQTHFFMEDVRIPEENVLVRGREAFKQQLKALNWERVGSAAYANAMSRCALDHALEYAQEREQFDQRIADFQGLRWKLADAVKELEAARSLTYRAAIGAQSQSRVPDRLTANVAKLYASETVERVVSEALQLFGAAGYQREHPLEYLYRLQRGRRIAAGTDEITKNTIADVLLDEGLPSIA
ncbi:acyl-CoA dehydrogenase family protein [Natronomonas marina]|jgi:alkylation response protein AidB-like acyl-CoA dehydrogenase|uniref:acyl-CoA dehydrogenase family protein n=1 Tax=Natronomonas marina TaxID=2961939 RepID=UPI0020C948B5|nr:acyl-CoA dehydrogenase family protein [Natronomonas marina]